MVEPANTPAAAATEDVPAAGTTPADANRPARVRRPWTLWRKIKWTVRGAFLVLIAGVFVLGCDSCFYFPSKKIYLTPQDMHLTHEDVWITTSDGVKLHGWFLPATTNAASQSSVDGGQSPSAGRSGVNANQPGATGLHLPAPTIVHFHGNAENITNHLPLVAWLPWQGYNVFLFDYRGYGESEGRVTRKGTILDGLAAVDYVLARPDVDRSRVFAFGQSLGGAVATVVMAERPQLAGLVADCTFSSYRHIGSAHLRKLLRFKPLSDALAAALLSNDYEPLDYVAKIAPRPILVITSAEDELCFAELGCELFDAAREPKQLISLPRGAHLEAVLDNVEEVQTQMLDFLLRVGVHN